MPDGPAPVEPAAEILRYPLAAAAQAELIGLLRTEWTRTDYDWLEAMHGDYGPDLVITAVLLRRAGRAAATATLHYARARPEVAVLGNVLTHREHRGQGLAGRVVETALAQAATAGCALCLLGTSTKPRNVYLQHGFAWVNGSVMRRELGRGGEAQIFAAGQRAVIRPAQWGDLPGLTLLVAQPLRMAVLDHPRGLLSARYGTLERCLSNFPVLWYDTVGRGGRFLVLGEPAAGRVFGFGSITRDPGAARRHEAVIELAAHDDYGACLPALASELIGTARAAGVKRLRAVVAAVDVEKSAVLEDQGFSVGGRLPRAWEWGAQLHDAVQLARDL